MSVEDVSISAVKVSDCINYCACVWVMRVTCFARSLL